MRIIEWSEFLETASPFGGKESAITVGVFDGVHLGHKALINRIVSHNDKAVPVVVTFRQSHHKKAAGNGKEYQGDILSFRQKTDIFESLGVSVTIVIEFSESFKRMAGMDFFRILQEHGKMKFLALGSNFRCGYKLDTGALAIQELNARKDIHTCIVQPLAENGKQISSSQIRDAIAQRDLKAASVMLGRPFTVDLYGASVSSASNTDGGCVAYDISGQGRILPPPGSYNAALIGKKEKRPAEILIEGGCIIISGALADGAEYVEFLPE